MQESPRVALAALPQSDLVAAVTPGIAHLAIEAGGLSVLPWRAPWLSVHPGMVWLRKRNFGDPEQAFIDLIRAADEEMHHAAEVFCARFGLSPNCEA